jgi:signal transduction histidine kinase
VLEDRDGNLWIGTNGSGLDRLDAATGRWSHYQHSAQNTHSLGSNAILALLEAADGTIWVGGWGAGFGRLDPRTGQVRSYRHDPKDSSSLANDNVWQILELRDGALLVTTQGGAFTFDRRTERFTRISRASIAGGDDWYGAAEDARGDVWIGGVSGVQHVTRATGEVRSYRTDPALPQGLGPGWVMSVHADRRGDIWFGTESGLIRHTPITGAWARFTTADGLGHDTVMGILEDDQHRLWVSTIRGITRVESHGGQGVTPHFVNFESRDGLTNTFFTRGAAFRGPSGRLYFGGARGLTHFMPAEVRANDAPPPVVFTALRILNAEARPGAPGSPLAVDIAETKDVTLSHRDATVTFEFAALNLVLPHKNRYAYRLEGFEDHWNEVGGQRFATYTSLPPGSYTLQVRAANDDGVWNQEGARLRITVLPPFYRSLWFRLLVLVGLGAILAVAHALRVERIRNRARELEAKVEERTREVTAAHSEALAANAELEAFAYSVSHDLRAPLRSVDGFSRILAADYGERLDEEGRRLLGLVRGSAQRMGRLIDDLLGFSRLGRQGLKVETVDMDRLVREAWEELRRDLPNPPVLEVGPLAPASGDGAMIRQVVTNLLSNAVKFSTPVASPRVEVGSQAGDRENEYTVRDNGVGFDMQYAHKLFGVFQRLHSLEEFDGTGVGLAIVERVVRRHGGRVWAESEEGKGATFHFSLPRPVETERAAEPATAFADRLRPGP